MNKKCQIFTPPQYVKKMLKIIDYSGEKILGKYVLENSCGEGNILLEIVERYIKAALKKNYDRLHIKYDLETFIVGFEIDLEIKNICMKRLDKLCSKYKIFDVQWNIHAIDYLKVSLLRDFDYIIGNPPYIAYPEIQLQDRIYLKTNYISCKFGKFDCYYAFIEKSILNLNEDGKLVYIIPNNIFKTTYGSNIRNIIKPYIKKIIDYKYTKVFGKVCTSPAIILLNKGAKRNSVLHYISADEELEYKINKKSLESKWLFNKVASTKKNKNYFKDFFKVSNCIATLANAIFVIKHSEIFKEDENYIYLKNHRIEKAILRKAVSPNSIKQASDESIIFPYYYDQSNRLCNYREIEFQSLYPEAYKYLYSCKQNLLDRAIDSNVQWFEYGRRQALLYLNQPKIIISSIVTTIVKPTYLKENVIPYSGFYIVPINTMTLEEGFSILESPEFLEHISIQGINANGRSIRLSVNDVLNFPLTDLKNKHIL